jgi:hypothetical protein
MHANTKTPAFRIGLSVAIVWLIATLAYGLTGNRFVTYVYQQAWVHYENRCVSESDELNGDGPYATSPRAMCAAANHGARTDVQHFMDGNPFWQAVKFVLLPPSALLIVIAYWRPTASRIKRLIARYFQWIRGTDS